LALNKDSSKILKELISKDKKLISVIDFDKECPLFGNPIISENNLFLEISQTIVGQQISFLAADAVWKRLLNSVNKKKDFLNLFENKNLKWARQQGLSERKYEYIRDLSLKIKKRDISLVKMSKLDDESVISELTKIRGIGPWTAEMFLMFGLKRKDIFSIGDLALLRAVSEIYKVDDKDHKKIIRITNKWKPYRSIVSWYLWEYLGV
tara:strand:- start:325 stop:948 length:624 start_codon:yes stop_codon:yes gene_type:complete